MWYDKGESYIKTHYTSDHFLQEFKDDNVASWIIYDDDNPIGILKINISKWVTDYSDFEAMELERIYLLKKASGKGIGKDAINFSIEFAKKHGKKILWLKAMDRQNPVDFYKKFGFEVFAKDTLDLPNIKNDFKKMVIMKKQINVI